jgi:hypothetical protein
MAHDLNLPTIADGQDDGQWQSSNDGDAALGNALGDIYTVDFTAGNVTLTAAQFRSAMTFVPSNLSATRVLTIPAVKRGLFFVHNTDAVDSITVTKGSTTISVGPGEIGALYTDGTTNSLEGAVIAEAGAAAPVPYDIPLSYAGGPPTSSEVIGRVVACRDIDFAANFAGSNGYIATNPTGSFVISVEDDGAQIGTITISTGGAFTFATASGTAKTVAAGSRLEFVAPASADATAADIAATLEGTV